MKDGLYAAALLLGAALLGFTAGVAHQFHQFPEPPPAQEQQPEVLRRLELRIKELDKPGARGDRYRLFECKEVPRDLQAVQR